MLKNTSLLFVILITTGLLFGQSITFTHYDVSVIPPIDRITSTSNATDGSNANVVWGNISNAYYNATPASYTLFPQDATLKTLDPSIYRTNNGNLYLTSLGWREGSNSYVLEYRVPPVFKPDTVRLGFIQKPTITVTGNRIHILYSYNVLGTRTIRDSYRNFMSRTWSIRTINNQQDADFGASIASYGSNLHAAWTTASYAGVFYDRSTNDGNSWDYYPDQIIYSGSIYENPAIAANGNNIYIAWVIQNDNQLWFAHSVDNGNSWTSSQIDDNLANDGKISIAVSMGQNHNLYIAYWKYFDGANRVWLKYYNPLLNQWFSQEIANSGSIGVYGQSISVNYNQDLDRDCIDIVWGLPNALSLERGYLSY